MHQQLHWIFIILGLVGCEPTPRTLPLVQPDIRVALAERYPTTDVFEDNTLQFDNAPVEPLDLPSISKALPDVRFFITQLRTGHFEYPQVSVSVAVPDQGPIAVLLSPTYSESDPAFTEVLLRARVSGALHAQTVAGEIACLFAKITHKGEIREPHYANGLYTANLWHGDLLWRQLLIGFADGRVSSVSLSNPKSKNIEPK